MGLNDKAGKPKLISVIGGFLKEVVLKKGIVGTLMGIVSPFLPNLVPNKDSENNGTKGKVNYLQAAVSFVTILAVLYLAYLGWNSVEIGEVLTPRIQG